MLRNRLVLFWLTFCLLSSEALPAPKRMGKFLCAGLLTAALLIPQHDAPPHRDSFDLGSPWQTPSDPKAIRGPFFLRNENLLQFHLVDSESQAAPTLTIFDKTSRHRLVANFIKKRMQSEGAEGIADQPAEGIRITLKNLTFTRAASHRNKVDVVLTLLPANMQLETRIPLAALESGQMFELPLAFEKNENGNKIVVLAQFRLRYNAALRTFEIPIATGALKITVPILGELPDRESVHNLKASLHPPVLTD